MKFESFLFTGKYLLVRMCTNNVMMCVCVCVCDFYNIKMKN